MRLDASAYAHIVDAAERAASEECCGLLIGTPHAIVQAWPARNLAAEPRRRYDLDPADHFAAIREARRQGLDVVGCYHSHPHSAAMPSPTDVAEGRPDFLYVIAGRASGERSWTLGAFRLDAANFVPVRLVSTPQGQQAGGASP
jgi:proteasome lid subunit RPN8/RPN11